MIGTKRAILPPSSLLSDMQPSLQFHESFNLCGSNSPPLAAYHAGVSSYMHKSHNVTFLLYHVVFPAKYRRAVFEPDVDEVLRSVCLEIGKRYQVKFL